MIANVFQVLAKELDAFFLNAPRRQFHIPVTPIIPTEFTADTSDPSSPTPDNDPAVKIIQLLRQENQGESIKFPANRVTPILVNMEEEGKLRPADRFGRVDSTGKRETVYPDVRLNLYILFVSYFYDYTDTLHYLGLIVKYFQQHPVLNQQNTPNLAPGIEQLMPELITLPFSEQNEVWNSLRTSYKPSLLYKVKMLVFQDQPAVMQPGEIERVEIDAGELE